MSKVRVPKEHRPPERFKPFFAKGMSGANTGWYKVAGTYRIPRLGEFYWSYNFQCVLLNAVGCTDPRVILIPCEAPV
jgi:hypothetical protein